jgi:hypothetical protein
VPFHPAFPSAANLSREHAATDRDVADLATLPVGSGATPLKAIEDLLWLIDVENVEPEQCSIVWDKS